MGCLCLFLSLPCYVQEGNTRSFLSVCTPVEEYPQCNIVHLSTDSWHTALTILLYNIIPQNKWLSLTMALPRIVAALSHLLKVSLPLHKFTVYLGACINAAEVDFWGSGCWNSSSWSYWCPGSLTIRFSENIIFSEIFTWVIGHWKHVENPPILLSSFLWAEFRLQFIELWVEDKRHKKWATAFTAGWGEPIPHNCLSRGPGCSSLADFNLGGTAHTKMLNFSSIPALTQGVSLRTLRSDRSKPIGKNPTRFMMNIGFLYTAGCYSSTTEGLCLACWVAASGFGVQNSIPWHDSLALSCIWWVIISIAESYYGLFPGHISMWADSHCHRKPLLAYECYYAINCFWYLTDFFFSLLIYFF